MTDYLPYDENQELDNNTSDNHHFRDILEQSMSRRDLIAKTASGAAALALASSPTACSDDNENGNIGDDESNPNCQQTTMLSRKLSFSLSEKNLMTGLRFLEGYTATVLYAMGDSNSSVSTLTGTITIFRTARFQFRSGDCQ